jgi:hypothetical protein
MAAASDFEVVRVVCGSDLNAAGTLVELCVFVRNDRNASADKRENDVLTDHVLVAFVVRVHRDGDVAEKALAAAGVAMLNEEEIAEASK